MCVTGEVVAESLFHMSATVSSLTTRSEGHRLAQTVSKIDHASHTNFHLHDVEMA